MSKIEWTDYTWNPVTGCTPCSPGCQNCYAEMISRRLKGRFGYHHQEPFKITFHQDKLYVPLSIIKPSKIFACSMGDLFHPDVPINWVYKVFHATMKAKHHNYQFLTKRPEVMLRYFFNLGYNRYSSVPNNYWFGVTAENQQMADQRLPILIKTPVPNRFVSIEPMLGPIDISQYIRSIDWVIIGGETGVRARNMDPNWARKIRDLCKAHDVPFFFKQMTKKVAVPKDLMVKQFPVRIQ